MSWLIMSLTVFSESFLRHLSYQEALNFGSMPVKDYYISFAFWLSRLAPLEGYVIPILRACVFECD